jgi:uncharacterized integral membrane protein
MLLKFLKLCFYVLLVLIGVTFAVSNRTRIDLTFYPLPYSFSVPLFLFAVIVFILGMVVGGGFAHLAAYRRNKGNRHASKRVTALEDEVTALRSEKLIRPAALPFP